MTATPYTLAEVENEIRSTYLWFHENAGVNVYPREEGQLGALWALFDLLIEEEEEEEEEEEKDSE